MKKKLLICTVVGFIFVSIVGTLCHFVFEWSHENIIAGLLTPINESSWEHLKLIFFPYLIWTAVEYLCLRKANGYLISKLIGVISGMLAIIIFFYTYTGIIGRNIDFLNILSFFIGVGVAFAVDCFLIKSNKFSERKYTAAAIAGFMIISILFMVFTFAPPFLDLFKDPINSTYGI